MDVKEYTARKLGEQIVAAEIHLTDYLQEGEKQHTSTHITPTDFCIECLGKHALAIMQFAQEGTQFFNTDPYFSRVYAEGTKLYNDLPNFNNKLAEEHYNRLRELRKEIISKHILLDALPSTAKYSHLNGNHIMGV